MQVYLRMCEVEYDVEECTSTHASPTGASCGCAIMHARTNYCPSDRIWTKGASEPRSLCMLTAAHRPTFRSDFRNAGELPALEAEATLLGIHSASSSLAGEASSPTGTCVFSIIEQLKAMGIDADAGLTPAEQADVDAHATHVHRKLALATAWAMWCDDHAYKRHTLPLFRGMYPPPMGSLHPWLRRRHVLAQLKGKGGAGPTLSDVRAQAAHAYEALAAKLEHAGGVYLVRSDRPTSLDALCFAHLLFHKAAPGGSCVFGDLLARHDVLVAYVDRVAAQHFGAQTPNLKPPGRFGRAGRPEIRRAPC